MDEKDTSDTTTPKEDESSKEEQVPGGTQGSGWNKETGGIQPGKGESESSDWKPKEAGRGTPESES